VSEPDDEPSDWDDDWDDSCESCDGTGERLICVDDICHGIGECIHGDGMITCPACKGTGIRGKATK
jgi:hypothetical protein